MESWISPLGLQKSVAEARLALMPRYSLSSALEANKPYFGRELAAFQSPPIRYALIGAFAKYALRGVHAGARLLEIGSWAGASTITLGKAIRSLGLSDSHIVCVDPWESYFDEVNSAIHYRIMNMAAATGQIERLFQHNIRACGLEEIVRVKKAHSREALPELSDGSFDLVYVDGSHRIDDVLYDLAQAKRLIKSGGLICGDDLELFKSQVEPEAHETALNNGNDFSVDPRSTVSYHPGVTEAIARTFDAVWQDKGFWCVQGSSGEWRVPELSVADLDIPSHLQHAVEIPFGQFRGHEVFQLDDAFVAYPAHGANWFQNRVVAGSLEELISLLDAIDSLNDKRSAHPQIIKTHRQFNIISYKHRVWALDTSVGKVDFRDEKKLADLVAAGRLFETDTLEKACAAAEEASRTSDLGSAERGSLLLEESGTLAASASGRGSMSANRPFEDFEAATAASKSQLEEQMSEQGEAVRMIKRALEKLQEEASALRMQFTDLQSAYSRLEGSVSEQSQKLRMIGNTVEELQHQTRALQEQCATLDLSAIYRAIRNMAKRASRKT